jgi:hypothetical protein
MNLEEKVDLFLREFQAPETETSTDEEYQAEFANEGLRKAQYVLEDLRDKATYYQFEIGKTAFLSIGGADGSEAEAVLRHSEISKAVLLELSSEGCKKARDHGSELAKDGKTLHVLEGDAVGRVDEALKFIKARGAETLVVSMQAIMHELPSRSAAFRDLNRWLGKLLADFPITLIYAREPCKPPNWPDELEIRIPGVSGEALARLARFVAAYLELPSDSIQRQPRDFVLGQNVLMVETLHKILRCKTVAQFKYEMQERLTSFDAEYVRGLLLEFCENPAFVAVDPLTTRGFREAFAEAKVSARDAQSKRPLPIPQTHVLIKAIHMQALRAKDVGAPQTRSDEGKRRRSRNGKYNLNGILSKTSPRRGRIHTRFRFVQCKDHPDRIRVIETSDYAIIDRNSEPRPFFQFGGKSGEILAVNNLSFSVQTGSNGPQTVAPKQQIFSKDVNAGANKDDLLALVTTPGEGGIAGHYVGLLKFVPLELVQRGHRMIMEADYVVPTDQLFTWRMGMATQGYDLTIAFPSATLGIQIEPFIHWAEHDTKNPDSRSYLSDDWIAPENGIVWRFISASSP